MTSAFEANKRFRAPLQVSGNGGCEAEAISACEARLKVILPNDFRRFYLEHDGGKPTPDSHTSRNGLGVVIRDFFPIQDCECINVPGLVEFGSSIFGDHYAISCRRADYGTVYWIDHECCDPDALRTRLLSLIRWLPASWGVGIYKIANSFDELRSQMHFSRGDWLIHLLRTSSDAFRAFAEEVAFVFDDEIGTPMISVVASYGSLDDFCFVAERTTDWPKDIVSKAVRNERDASSIVDYLLTRGADGEHCYVEGSPYPMGYAKKHNLTDVVEVLKRHGVPETQFKEFV